MFRTLVKLKDAALYLDAKAAVLVRLKNEGAHLPRFLRSLSQQRTSFQFEIIFLDSGSTDETLSILMSIQNAAIYSIDPSEFRFGETCNLMMELSSAEIGIFFSAHVELLGADVLQTMVDTICNNNIDAVAIRQIPNANVGYSIYEKAFLARRFPSKGGETILEGGVSCFSNAGSALRRSAWKKCRFPDVVAGEDGLWAQSLSRSGGSIAYLPNVMIAHSHHESPDMVHKRVYINKISIFGNKRMFGRAAYYFFGLYLVLIANGESIARSYRYAWAHASAYL